MVFLEGPFSTHPNVCIERKKTLRDRKKSAVANKYVEYKVSGFLNFCVRIVIVNIYTM